MDSKDFFEMTNLLEGAILVAYLFNLVNKAKIIDWERLKMKIEHVGLFVEDLERTVEFYQKFFGATASEKYHNPVSTFSSRFLTFQDGARLEVCTREDLNSNKLSGYPLGYMHMAMSLGSKKAVNELSEAIEKAGYQHLSGPRVTGDGYYESVVCDPEGNQIELTI
ncbi:lactoylglutathione lyase related lyase [Companilactobacillus kimchiensis]|uniref:Lactoylglutathione lyase related lyase n=2 Tax=Companilactobacillus kimchiensis TaxID=993692 RepID=A0A0R2KZ49_9LACO|nr:lactoylglutathione lyase related lyase [Companilactobacillus kimchiensis]